MVEFVTSAQMRAIEGAAIDSFSITGAELMERAGAGLVRAVFAHWPMLERETTQALVLCGPGNNGGDGYVIARHLAQRGIAVHVLALGQPDTLPPDARANWAAWLTLGPVLPYGAAAFDTVAAQLDPARPVLIVDALFGIGLSRPLAATVTDPFAAFMAELRAPCWLVAVDVPSGLSDSMPHGRRLAGFDNPALPRLTVTFHALKPAHAAQLDAGEDVVVVDIGLPPAKDTP